MDTFMFVPTPAIIIAIIIYRTLEYITSFPYFGVKLSCVCLMIAYRKKIPEVT